MKIIVLLALLAVSVRVVPAAMAQKADSPRVSATDSCFLSCTVWTGHDWTKPTERSARTQVLVSPNGLRAYGQVSVAIKDGSCENTTTLNVASNSGQAFRVVYTKSPANSAYSDGNGIRVIGWSPSGDKLVADINVWEYETDRGYSHAAVIYDNRAGSAKEIPALDEAVSRHFGPDCEYELAVTGWRTDEQILVKVLRTPKTDQYPQRFCVKEPRTFVFDLPTNTLKAEPQSAAGTKPQVG